MKLTNCTQNFDFVEKIFNQWEGKITKEEDGIRITSNNLLGDKRVECNVKVGYLKSEKYPYCVDADEKTLSIIGGCGCPCENIEEVEKNVIDCLTRYKFRQKEQLSLFDFVD